VTSGRPTRPGFLRPRPDARDTIVRFDDVDLVEDADVVAVQFG
jgi:hypothetical protein